MQARALPILCSSDLMHEGKPGSLRLRQLVDVESSTISYLMWDSETKEAILVDPVRGQFARDTQLISELALTLVAAVDTHVHADHVTAAGALRDATGCLSMSGAGGAPCVDRALAHGDVVQVGLTQLRVLSTPGHTSDSISLAGAWFVLTGDALLVRGCGRTDFQNGDAGALYDSITQHIFTLPPETLVYPGHDYRGHLVSTVAEECMYNARISGKTREAFVTHMRSLVLPLPKHIHEAVPANQACGNEPSASTD